MRLRYNSNMIASCPRLHHRKFVLPKQVAGLRIGDWIVEVEGFYTQDIAADIFEQIMRGPSPRRMRVVPSADHVVYIESSEHRHHAKQLRGIRTSLSSLSQISFPAAAQQSDNPSLLRGSQEQIISSSSIDKPPLTFSSLHLAAIRQSRAQALNPSIQPHVLLPLCLLFTCISRVNLISLIYLLAMIRFIMNCVTARTFLTETQCIASSRSYGKTINFLFYFSAAVCCIAMIAQLVYLSYASSYRDALPDNSTEEVVMRQVGFARWNGSAWTVFRAIVPDILTVIITYWIRREKTRLVLYMKKEHDNNQDTNDVGCNSDVSEYETEMIWGKQLKSRLNILTYLPATLASSDTEIVGLWSLGVCNPCAITALYFIFGIVAAFRSSVLQNFKQLPSIVISLRMKFTALIIVLIYVVQFDVCQQNLPNLSNVGLIEFWDTQKYRDGRNSLDYIPAAAWNEVIYIIALLLVFIIDIKVLVCCKLGIARPTWQTYDQLDDLDLDVSANRNYGTSAMRNLPGRQTSGQLDQMNLDMGAHKNCDTTATQDVSEEQTGNAPFRPVSKSEEESKVSSSRYSRLDMLNQWRRVYRRVFKRALRAIRSFFRSRWLHWIVIADGVAWAVIFPSWYGLVILLWAFLPWDSMGLHFLHSRYFFRILPIITCSMFIVLISTFVLALPSSQADDQTMIVENKFTTHAFGLGYSLRISYIQALIIQSAMISVVLTAHHAGEWLRNKPYAEEEIQRPSIIARGVVDNLYIVTFAVIYWASLQSITIVNTGYLLVLLFNGVRFRKDRQSIWVVLTVYCQLVICLFYAWIIASSSTDQTVGTRLFGLPAQSSEPQTVLFNLWSNLIIYYSSSLQLVALKNIEHFQKILKKRSAASAELGHHDASVLVEMLQQPSNVEGTACERHAPLAQQPPVETSSVEADSSCTQNLPRQSSQISKSRISAESNVPPLSSDTADVKHPALSKIGKLLRSCRWCVTHLDYVWTGLALIILTLFVVQGKETFFRLGYLLFVFAAMFSYAISRNKSATIILDCLVLYSGAVLMTLYMFQYEQIYSQIFEGYYATYDTEAEYNAIAASSNIRFIVPSDCRFGSRCFFVTNTSHNELISDLGLSVVSDGEYIKMLIVETVILVMFFVRLRLADRNLFVVTKQKRHEPALLQIPTEISDFPPGVFLWQIAIFVMKVVNVSAEVVAISLAFFSAVRDDKVSAFGFITVLIVAAQLWKCAVGIKGRQCLHLLQVWLSFSTLTRLVCSMPSVLGSNLAEYKASWIGVSSSAISLHHVNLEILAILFLVIDARSAVNARYLWTEGKMSKLWTLSFFSFSTEISDMAIAAVRGIIRRYGSEICLTLGLVTAFARLNIVGVIYVLLVGVLLVKFDSIDHEEWHSTRARKPRRKTSRLVSLMWSSGAKFVILLLIYQYLLALGMWPSDDSTSHYTYDDSSFESYRSSVLQSWLYWSPVRERTFAEGYNINTTKEYTWNLQHAPKVWVQPSALKYDFVWACAMSVYCYFIRESRERFHSKMSEVAQEKLFDVPKSAALISTKENIIRLVPWFAGLFAMLTVLTRSDLLLLMVFLWVLHLLNGHNKYFFPSLSDTDTSAKKMWTRLLAANYLMLLLRICWTLPSRYVDWDGMDSRGQTTHLSIAEVFGLRYGHGIKLKSIDPDAGVWGTYGIGFDIILFALILLQLHMLSTRTMRSLGYKMSLMATASSSLFLDEVYPNYMSSQIQKRYLYDSGRKQGEILCGKVMRRVTSTRKHASRRSTELQSGYHDAVTAYWFSDPKIFTLNGRGFEFTKHKEYYFAQETKLLKYLHLLYRVLKNSTRSMVSKANLGALLALERLDFDGEALAQIFPEVWIKDDDAILTEKMFCDGMARVHSEKTLRLAYFCASGLHAWLHEVSRKGTALQLDNEQKKRRSITQKVGDVLHSILSAVRIHVISLLSSLLIALRSETAPFKKLVLNEINGLESARVTRREDMTSDENSSKTSNAKVAESEHLPNFDEGDDDQTNKLKYNETDNDTASVSSATANGLNFSVQDVFSDLNIFIHMHTDAMCIIMLYVSAIFNASLLSVVYALAWLLVGVFWLPFPTYRFWQSMIYYTEFVIVVRLIFQFQIWGVYFSPDYEPTSLLGTGVHCDSYYLSEGCGTFARALGVVRQNDSGPGYMRQLIPDVLLLICLLYHRAMMVRMGMWGVSSNTLDKLILHLQRTRARGSARRHRGQPKVESSYTEVVDEYLPGFGMVNEATLSERFDEIDTENSGRIEEENLGSAMRYMGLDFADIEIARLLRVHNAHSNGDLDLEGFLRIMTIAITALDVTDDPNSYSEFHSNLFDAIRESAKDVLTIDNISAAMRALGLSALDEFIEAIEAIAELDSDSNVASKHAGTRISRAAFTGALQYLQDQNPRVYAGCGAFAWLCNCFDEKQDQVSDILASEKIQSQFADVQPDLRRGFISLFERALIFDEERGTTPRPFKDQHPRISKSALIDALDQNRGVDKSALTEIDFTATTVDTIFQWFVPKERMGMSLPAYVKMAIYFCKSSSMQIACTKATIEQAQAVQEYDHLAHAFSLIDDDHSGFITADELVDHVHVLAKGSTTTLTKEEIRDWIKVFDSDGDSELSLYEFVILVKAAVGEAADDIVQAVNQLQDRASIPDVVASADLHAHDIGSDEKQTSNAFTRSQTSQHLPNTSGSAHDDNTVTQISLEQNTLTLPSQNVPSSANVDQPLRRSSSYMEVVCGSNLMAGNIQNQIAAANRAPIATFREEVDTMDTNLNVSDDASNNGSMGAAPNGDGGTDDFPPQKISTTLNIGRSQRAEKRLSAPAGGGVKNSVLKTFFGRLWNIKKTNVPEDLYKFELPIELLLFILFIPVWGSDAFEEGERRRSSTTTQGGADSEVSGAFSISWLDLCLMLRQFIMLVCGRMIFSSQSIRAKLVLHYYRTLETFMVFFFWLPMRTGYSFHSNSWGLTFFYLNLIYLILSARQLYIGYPSHGYLIDSFTRSNDKKLYYLWVGFRTLPFALELRNIMDWVVTDTTLTLREYFKLEDILAQLHMNRMGTLASQDWAGRHFGERQPWFMKFFGAAALVPLLILVWLPLILIPISSATSDAYIPIGCTLKASVSWTDGEFSRLPIELYRSRAEPTGVDGAIYGELKQFDKTGYTSLYSENDLAIFSFRSYSPARWAVSPDVKEEFACAVSRSVTLYWQFIFEFDRDKKGEAAQSVVFKKVIPMDLGDPVNAANQSNLLDMLRGDDTSSSSTKYVHLGSTNENSLPMAILLDKSSTATELVDSYVKHIRSYIWMLLRESISPAVGSAGKYWWYMYISPPESMSGVSGDTSGTETCDASNPKNLCYSYRDTIAASIGDSLRSEYRNLRSDITEVSQTVDNSLQDQSCTTNGGALSPATNTLYQSEFYQGNVDPENTVAWANKRIHLITYNKRVSNSFFASFSSGSLGLLGLYTTVVLVVGQFVRLMFSKLSQRIVYEDMAQCTTLSNLIYSIFIARETKHMQAEEELWRLLVRIYRHPPSLVLWTNLQLLRRYDSATLRHRELWYCFDRYDLDLKAIRDASTADGSAGAK